MSMRRESGEAMALCAYSMPSRPVSSWEAFPIDICGHQGRSCFLMSPVVCMVVQLHKTDFEAGRTDTSGFLTLSTVCIPSS